MNPHDTQSPPDHGHQPVLLRQTLALLDPQPGQTLIDLTVGRGGHAEAIARIIGPAGRILAFDADADAVNYARRRLEGLGPAVEVVHANFREAPAIAQQRGLSADMLLADLGFSSPQIDDPARGFSFTDDGPLDMRMDSRLPVTAADIVNRSNAKELADLIFQYGEEPFSRKIAAEVLAFRNKGPILTTAQLAEIVRSAYGPRARSSRLHPATRVFMALRIAVNDELGSLQTLWQSIARTAEAVTRADEGTHWLAPDARIAVIGFHSLEDRINKRAAADIAKRGLATLLTRKPVTADDDEIRNNPRARSAKLRAIRLGSKTLDSRAGRNGDKNRARRHR